MSATVAPEDVGFDTGRLERVTEWMNRYVDAGKLPGCLTLIARHGEIAYLESVGKRNLETGEPVTLDTIWRFYSMTKPITIVAALSLLEEARFRIDDPIGDYIPELADMNVLVQGDDGRVWQEPAKTPITIGQLMRHTSGLTYGFSDPGPVGDIYRELGIDMSNSEVPLEEMIGRVAQAPLCFHPGTRWNYGVSTDVIGRLIEVISGQTLGAFFAERIFEPLGMAETGFSIPGGAENRFAALYGPTKDDAGQHGMSLIDAPAGSRFTTEAKLHSGGGGLASTAQDYFRFTEMLRRGGELDGARILGRKTVEFMTMNHLPGDLAEMGQPVFSETSFSGIGFGLGVSVMLDPAKAGVPGSPGEFAWGGAASTAFWIDPVEDLTVIFLTQLLPSSTYPIRRELKALAYQALVDDPSGLDFDLLDALGGGLE